MGRGYKNPAMFSPGPAMSFCQLALGGFGSGASTRIEFLPSSSLRAAFLGKTTNVFCQRDSFFLCVTEMAAYLHKVNIKSVIFRVSLKQVRSRAASCCNQSRDTVAA